MDMQMPVMDSWTAARHQTRNLGTRCPPLIALTAADLPEARQAASPARARVDENR